MRKSWYLSSIAALCFLLFSVTVKAAVHIITSSPRDTTVHAGVTTGFRATGTDTSTHHYTVSYTWIVSADGGAHWALSTDTSIHSTGTLSVYNVVANPALNGNKFKCVATDSLGSDTSAAATLTVLAAPPVIRTQPQTDSACAGATATFMVVATDTPGALMLYYQWFVSSNDTIWTALTDGGFYSGSATNALGVTADSTLGGHYYRCVVMDSSATDTSVAARLIIDSMPHVGVITGPSVGCRGASITLADTVAGGVWSTSHPLTDTVSSTGMVYALAAGLDTIKYTISNGGCHASITHPVRFDTTAMPMPVTGPTATCVGHVINLSDLNTLGTWIWSATNTSASVTHGGVVTGLSHGMDTIVYSFTNGCNTVNDSLVITVDTLLGHGVISGPTSVCSHSWVNLTESLAGGVWISSNSTVATIDGSGNVTGVAPGTTTISYYFSNACGASVATRVMTVDVSASVITGMDSVHVGSTITLADSVGGGTWTIGDTSIARISSTGVVTGRATGSTVVTYTVTNACGTSTATYTVYAGSSPSAGTIAGADSVCNGSHITLTDTALGGLWSSSNTATATVNSTTGVVTGVAYGEVTITYAVTNAFGTNFTEKVVFVNQPPTVTLTGPTVVATGGSYYLTGSPLGGIYGQNSTAMAELIGYGFFVVTGHGSVIFSYTVSNTCGPATAYDTINYLLPGGVNTPTAGAATFKIFPNPSNGDFAISLQSAITEPALVTITNVAGIKVKELTVSTNATTNVSLDEPAGVYIINAATANGKYTTKVTVTK